MLSRIDLHRPRKGYTLLELLLVLAILALLAIQAVPTAQALLAKQRLKGAAEWLAAELRSARLEAIRLNRTLTVRLAIQTPLQWCIGISDEGVCDCRRSRCRVDGRPAPRLDSRVLPHIRLAGNFPDGLLLIGPLRGGARAGSLRLGLAGKEIRIVVSSLGRIRLCSETLSGYGPC